MSIWTSPLQYVTRFLLSFEINTLCTFIFLLIFQIYYLHMICEFILKHSNIPKP